MISSCEFMRCISLMMTSSNGNIFRVTGHLCGNSPVPGEFPTQRPVTRSFDVFFDLCRNKRLSKQWWGWWFETLSRPLWRHRNVILQECFPTTCQSHDKGEMVMDDIDDLVQDCSNSISAALHWTIDIRIWVESLNTYPQLQLYPNHVHSYYE